MNKSYNPDLVELIFQIIQRNTKPDANLGSAKPRSDLSFRKLLEKVRKAALEKELIPPGRDRLVGILKLLSDEGRIEVRVNGVLSKTFYEQQISGSRWETVAKSVSKETQSKVHFIRLTLGVLRQQLTELETISKNRKFTSREITKYVTIKNQIFSFPFEIYVESEDATEALVDNIVKDIILSAKKSALILHDIRLQQRKFYSAFDAIVAKIEEISRDNMEVLGVDLLAHKSVKDKHDEKKITWFLPGKVEAAKNFLKK